ncbi:MAG TPA: glycoside hydrolase family 47 protein [Bacteroidaceae bacterium]|nr:glycoside hydrolase family 47 protein [Bacteroidaceae bacterium]
MKEIIWIILTLFALTSCKTDVKKTEKEVYAERVKKAFVKGWKAYKLYAYGKDAVNPIACDGHNWYSETLLMTPVDAYSTMCLMGLDSIKKEAKDLIFSNMDFDKDMKVQQFEIAIRLVGGLVSSYQLDGDKRFLDLAVDLADRLMPVFDTPTGIPYRMVNLHSGEIEGNITNPCEVGSMLLEYGMLSKLTGNPEYYDKCKRGIVALYNLRGKTGLVGSRVNCDTGEWLDNQSHIGGGIDAFYEYLLKGYILFGDKDLKNMWENSLSAINKYLVDEMPTGYWLGVADMDTGKRTATVFGALHCFWNGCLVLEGEIEKAKKLQESIYKMWTLHGIEPEMIDYTNMEVVSPYYMIRPEAIESTYYIWKATGDNRYYEMGKTMFESIEKYCQVENGYVQLKDVRTKEKWDTLESFFFAETMKYCYLFFAPDSVFNFKNYVLNTEAHPLKNTWDVDWRGDYKMYATMKK